MSLETSNVIFQWAQTISASLWEVPLPGDSGPAQSVPPVQVQTDCWDIQGNGHSCQYAAQQKRDLYIFQTENCSTVYEQKVRSITDFLKFIPFIEILHWYKEISH